MRSDLRALTVAMMARAQVLLAERAIDEEMVSVPLPEQRLGTLRGITFQEPEGVNRHARRRSRAAARRRLKL